jgi:hypothetical protein
MSLLMVTSFRRIVSLIDLLVSFDCRSQRVRSCVTNDASDFSLMVLAVVVDRITRLVAPCRRVLIDCDLPTLHLMILIDPSECFISEARTLF